MTGHATKSTGGEHPRHEPDKVNVTAIIGFTVLLIVSVAVIQFAVWGLIGLFEKPAGPPAVGRIDPPFDPKALAHWENPPKDRSALETLTDERLHQYGWIDREQGSVRIPIEKALNLMLRNATQGSTDYREAALGPLPATETRPAQPDERREPAPQAETQPRSEE